VPPTPFQSTQLLEAADLMRVSEFERQQNGRLRIDDAEAGATRLSALNPSLMQDLLRFEPGQGESLDLLQVLAASLRHGRPLLLHLQMVYRVIPLTIWPAERQAQSALPLAQLLELRLPELRVLRVEPAPARAADGSESPSAEQAPEPLAPLLWELALRGSRASLLPEIAGVAAYRAVPGTDLQQLDLTGSLAAAVARLRQQPTPLREIAGWAAFDRERAIRLLNGLYLLGSLMISRTHPAAIGSG
jgi:hypothetical protein